MRQNFDEIPAISCFRKPLPLRGTVLKTKTQNEKNPRQKQKQCQVPDSCPLPGSTRWPKPHSRLAASLPTPRYRLYGGVWLLILRVAPRLNSRAEPEHYIQALAPAEARKNEGVGASPPRCDNNAYAVLQARQDLCTEET